MQESQTNQVMFQLLQCALLGTPHVSALDLPEDTDWAAIFQEMKDQTVHGLVEPILDELPITDLQVKEAWRLSCMQQQARWYQVAAAQQELLELLDTNHIPCVIIKGVAAAQYYPRPECRVSGDVDFLVERSMYQTATELLQQHGYSLSEEDELAPHHRGFWKNGISFELHRWLGSVDADNEALITYVESGIGNRIYEKNTGAPVLPPDLNGLSLLLHINQHLRSGLGLRQIIDWMLFVDEETDEALWQHSIMPLLQRFGFVKLAAVVTRMSQNYLGLRSELAWCPETDESLCDALMDYILAKGNFGRKSSNSDRIANAFLYTDTLAHTLKRLQQDGLRRWKAAKKHTYLRPFAWLFRIGEIIKSLLTGKHTVAELSKLKDDGERQRDLIYSLGLQVEKKV